MSVYYNLTEKNVSQIFENKNDCEVNDDCLLFSTCVFDQELEKNVCLQSGKKICSIYPNTQLEECDLDNPQSCANCVNVPSFSCTLVDNDINSNNYKPYKFIYSDGKQISIPSSDYKNNKGWCLPNIKGTLCNPYTSDTVLNMYGDNEYNWQCLCTTNLMQNKSNISGADCTDPTACGEQLGNGKLYLKPDIIKGECETDNDCIAFGTENKGVCKKRLDDNSDNKYCYYVNKQTCSQNSDCKGYDFINPSNPSNSDNFCYQSNCYYRWNEFMESDPKYGVCECSQGYRYVSDENTNSKNCIKDSCSNVFGGKFNVVKQQCDCPDGYISSNILLCNKSQDPNDAVCIKDPCNLDQDGNTQKKGYYDQSSNSCICIGDNKLMKNNNPQTCILDTCGDPCQQQNPCGNRGTCYTQPDNSPGNKYGYDLLCKNCVCPYTGELCSEPEKLTLGQECESDDQCCNGNCKLCTFYEPFHKVCANECPSYIGGKLS